LYGDHTNLYDGYEDTLDNQSKQEGEAKSNNPIKGIEGISLVTQSYFNPL